MLKPKYLFGETELVNFNKTFWTVDESYFVHPRNKAQIPFLLAIYCWTGARVGAFFPNGKDKDKDVAGLRYRVRFHTALRHNCSSAGRMWSWSCYVLQTDGRLSIALINAGSNTIKIRRMWCTSPSSSSRIRTDT